MNNRTRLLAASLLSSLSSLSLAACSSSSEPDPGGAAGVGAPSGGSSLAGASTGGAGKGGITGSGGTGVGAGGSSPNTGGTLSTGNTGGTSASAGTTSVFGGTTSNTGGTSASAGTTGVFGGTTSNTGGTSASAGTASTSGGSGVAGAAAGGTGPNGSAGGATKCTLPNLPDANALTSANQKLPDPFTFFDGTKVTTKEQWECRRREILAMAAKYIYGPVPGEPDKVTGTVNGGTVSITCTVGSKMETFSASISGSGDVIALELSGGIFPASRKKLTFGSGFEAKIRSLFGLSELNGNVANGWMIDRVMDVLEQNPDSGHDPKKMMVSGCSGCGKGAFVAGVFSRVPLTVIVESGGGGVSNLRQTQWFRHGAGGDIYRCDTKPQGIDNLENNGICGPWVSGAASWLRSTPAKVYNLPFDQHLLLATIAPRYLAHFTNDHGVNTWCHLGGTGEALSAWAAEPVWNALGVPERMGFLQYDAGHCSNPREAVALAGEFFKRAFQGDTSAKTDVMQIMEAGVQQPVSAWKAMWVDWNMETVLQ